MDLVTAVMTGVFIFMCLYLFWMWFCFGNFLKNRQKTRNPQQTRTYMGTRSRTSLPPTEPTIYVSPANLPPPPKYEAMAPPSYEEVVGTHYPSYQPSVQPINHAITTALATQSSNSPSNATNIASNDAADTVANEPTTITTVDERRPVSTAA